MNHMQKGIKKSEAYMYSAPQSVANDVTDKVLNLQISTESPHLLSIIPFLYVKGNIFILLKSYQGLCFCILFQ